MTLELLICTIDKGIDNVANLLLPPTHNVKYLVSWQCADISSNNNIPEALKRDDVTVTCLQGKGLSRNRNNALAHATGDICLIADDDCTYKASYFNKIIEIFEAHPAVDLGTFKMHTSSHFKSYPSFSFDLRQSQNDYYASAIEIAFRRTSIQGKITFNELFGLGAPVLTCGEDKAFIIEALNKNLHCEYFPYVIVEHLHTISNDALGSTPKGIMASGACLKLDNMNNSTFTQSLKLAKTISNQTDCSYFKVLHYIHKGISYIKKNSKTL